MGTITVRTRSLVWFALGIVTAVLAGAVWMSAWSADAAPGDSDTTVVPITACRLTDTRPDSRVGPRSSPLGPDETETIAVQDASTKCVGKVPADATGLLVNVTAVQPSAPTFLSLWDEGPFPGTSSLNPVPGPPVPNAVTTKLAGDDTFRIYNRAGTTHVVIDVVGYLSPSSLTELAARLAAVEASAASNASGVSTNASNIAALDDAQPFVVSDQNGSDQFLTPTVRSLEAVTVAAPVDGRVTVSASLKVYHRDDGGDVACLIAPTAALPLSLEEGDDRVLWFEGLGLSDDGSIAGTSVFDISSGETVEYSVGCFELGGNSGVVQSVVLAATFTPTP